MKEITDKETNVRDKKPQGLLMEAHELINGPRQEIYGDPTKNWCRTAAIMSEYLGHEISAHQACVLMILVKVSRLCNGFHRDSLLDIAGYAGIADMVYDGD